MEKNKEEKSIVSTRIPYLDYFRGIIILLMIQGHLFRALLENGLRSGPVFRIHEYIHGVVAPGFLFLAGFLFYRTIHNKSRSDLLRKVRQLSGIIILGYFMHLPFFSLQKIIELWGTGIEYKLLRMDILHTIGFSLLIALLFKVIFKQFFLPAISLLIIFNVASPFILKIPGNIVLASFVDSNMSQFPFIYWSFYLFLGILASGFLKKFNIYVLLFSIGLMVTVNHFPPEIKKIVVDTGKVMFLFSIVSLLRQTSSPFLKKFLTASRESLFLYMSHLMIIFGSPLNYGLSRYLTGSLSLIESILLLILMVVILYSAAYHLHRFKTNSAITYNTAKYALFTFFLFVFLFSKW